MRFNHWHFCAQTFPSQALIMRSGAEWCDLVYDKFMAVVKRAKKTVRRSISLASDTDAKVQKLARRQRQSANRVLESLIETGLAAKEAEKRRFFDLADRLRSRHDQADLQEVKDELARMTIGNECQKCA